MRSSTRSIALAPKKSKWWRKDSFFAAHIAGSRRSQLPVSGPGIFLRHRGQRFDYPFERENHSDFGAFVKLGFQGKRSTMEFDEDLHDR